MQQDFLRVLLDPRLQRAVDAPGTSVLRGCGTDVIDLKQTANPRANAAEDDLIALSVPVSSAMMS